MDVELQQMLICVADIGGVVAVDSDSLGDQPGHLLIGQAAGVLAMAAVDDIGQRVGAAAFRETHAHCLFKINRGDELPLAKIGDGLFAITARDAERHALARAAAVEAEHETRPLGRAAVDMGENAEGSVIAVDPGQRALDEVEAGPPHQRTIAKNPEVVVAGQVQ